MFHLDFLTWSRKNSSSSIISSSCSFFLLVLTFLVTYEGLFQMLFWLCEGLLSQDCSQKWNLPRLRNHQNHFFSLQFLFLDSLAVLKCGLVYSRPRVFFLAALDTSMSTFFLNMQWGKRRTSFFDLLLSFCWLCHVGSGFSKKKILHWCGSRYSQRSCQKTVILASWFWALFLQNLQIPF